MIISYNNKILGRNDLIVGYSSTPPGPIPVVPIPGTDTILGLTYNTVQIGNRIWTCQNFEFPSTSDASSAGFTTSDYHRNALTKSFGTWTQACSFSGSTNFSWGWKPPAISKLASTLTGGWRVPTETDWLDLFSKTDQEGLRNTRSDNWEAGAGTNYWYFNADGYCGSRGTSWSVGMIIYTDNVFRDAKKIVKAYWTSTEDSSNYRIAYITTDTGFNNGALLGVYNWTKSLGTSYDPVLSIRLVKDAT